MSGNSLKLFGTEPRVFDPETRRYPPLYPKARMYLHLAWDQNGRIAGFGGLLEHEESEVKSGGYIASRTLHLAAAGICPLRSECIAVSETHELYVLTQLALATEHIGQLVTAEGIHERLDELNQRMERHKLAPVIPYTWYYTFAAAVAPDETLVERCLDLGIPCAPNLHKAQIDEADKARLQVFAAALFCTHQYQANRLPGQISSNGSADLAAWIQRDPALAALQPIADSIVRQQLSK